MASLAAGAYWLSSSHEKGADEKFETLPVEYGELVDAINASGVFQPREIVPVGSELAGRVVKLYPQADFNKHVDKTQPLLELDRSQAELRLAQARIARQEALDAVDRAEKARGAAKSAFDYAQKMFAQEVIKQPQRDQAELQFHEAEAAVHVARDKVAEAENAIKQAELGLEKLTVKSPVGGTILDRKVAEGQIIGPPVSAHLFTIASDMSTMNLHAQIAEADVNRVKVGQKAEISVYAYSQTDYKPAGKVVQIRLLPPQQPGAAAGAVYYDAVIDVPNQRDPDKAWMLLPAMTATVDIIRDVHHNVWKIPKAALELPQMDEHYLTPEARAQLATIPPGWDKVWILKDNKPWPIFVRLKSGSGEPGISDNQYREVSEWHKEIAPMLKPGDPKTYPHVITNVPPVRKGGFLDSLKFKI
jgi:HlyD family secretion protein